MPKFVALYSKPDDVEGFEQHYRDNHLAIVGRWPAVQSTSTTRFTRSPIGGDPAYHLMFEATAATDEDLKTMLGSDAAREAVQDAQDMEKRFGTKMTAILGTEL